MINYSKVCLSLLKKMPYRTREVVERRFGLGSRDKRETLESIGKEHGITRERVRQIEREGITHIKKQKIDEVFDYFEKTISGFGGFKKEDILISFLGKEKDKNNIFFLLVLDDNMERVLENKNLHTFWRKKSGQKNNYSELINEIIGFLEKEKHPLFIEEIYNKIHPKKIILPIFQSHIEISKQIQKNSEGKVGLKDWLEINPRGIKDKAYLVFKKNEKPLHFREVASLIKNSLLFPSRSVHTATVHNELIKDERFVLVGRGLYALKEWGYEPGVVKEIISKILSQAEEPLSRKEILERVLEKRMVKEHTILLNLQDKNKFIKNNEGRYMIKEA